MRIRVEQVSVPGSRQSFSGGFCIGRGADCEVQIDSDVVSRRHAEIFLRGGGWWVRDLGSTNGCFLDRKQIDEAPISEGAELQLAPEGPILLLTVEEGEDEEFTARRTPVNAAAPSAERQLQYHLARQRLMYGGFAAAVLVLLLGAIGFTAVQSRRLDREAAERGRIALELDGLRASAAGLFDEMRGLELRIVQIQELVEGSENRELAEQLGELQQTRQRMARRYDGYIQELGLYRDLSPREQVIYRMARVFNESEFGMPMGFVHGVEAVIRDYWQTPAGRGRFARAVRDAESKGFTLHIVRTLRRYHLPPQYFYLALQESNLNPRAVGPETRWGRAKGMWQFIPTTARMFHLDPGLYPNSSRLDPMDQRLDFHKSTDAAARYLRFIYGTLAQASGLLVMASYNWGEKRVLDKLERLADPMQAMEASVMKGIPQDPMARSYWRFLGEYRDRMPDETKDYVLKIFAAAVIGENPRLFGFDFDNPLMAHLD